MAQGTETDKVVNWDYLVDVKLYLSGELTYHYKVYLTLSSNTS